ncbi:hypothetical protein H6F38_20455 [Paenibacillus sp. EKM208P]|uniref:spermidine synthase n=1 Tax=Paenibacillus polymyxa TaxID=1406 RepID=UPI000FC110B5|nr:hypothetical protein H6F38_20455 [Paenibacillus sp. EKM208P]
MGQILYENESTQSFIQLSRKNSEAYIEYFKHNVFYSGIYPNVPLKVSFNLIATVFSKIQKSNKILILGTGFGGAAVQFKELRPDCQITTVDIEDVEELANEYFGLNKYPDIRFVTVDAIQFVKATPEKYDYILIDIFDEDRIPQGVISTDFISGIYSLLTPGGVLALNTNMRELQLFQQYSSNTNPLSCLHKQLYEAGFQAVLQNDFHNGGWMFGFKDKLDLKEFKSSLYEYYQMESNPYIKMSLAVSIIYLSKIQVSSSYPPLEQSVNPELDIIYEYRKYIFITLVSLLRRLRNMYADHSMVTRLCMLELQSLSNKLKRGEILEQDSGKKIFKCNDEEYYRKITFLDKQPYIISEIIPYLMLPDDLEMSIFKERHHSMILNLVYILGCYLDNEVVDLHIMDTFLKSEIGVC